MCGATAPVDRPGPDQGYFSEMAKSIFIADIPAKKEAARQEFERARINLNYVDGSRYMGAYLGPREDIEEWVRPKVET